MTCTCGHEDDEHEYAAGNSGVEGGCDVSGCHCQQFEEDPDA